MPSNPEASFSGLSEELVERIFSFLPPRDIMSASLVCRSFSRIAEPLLYRTMVIGALDGRGQKGIRALLDHPQYTTSVQDVVVYTSAPQLGRNSLANFTARQQETLGQWTPLHRELNRYIDIVGRAVQQMTSLQSLEVRFLRHSDLQELLRCIFRNYGKVGDPAKMFPKLASVRLRPIDDDEDEFVRVRLSALDPILSLSSLAELQACNVQIDGSPQEAVLTSCATALKTLVLKECPLRSHHVASLIRASPALETFDCEIMYDAEFAGTIGHYDIGEVAAALPQLRHTLRSLRLVIVLFTSTAIDIGNPGPWGVRSALGHALKDFAALRRLEVSLPVLLGWRSQGTAALADVLPASLEELVITQETAYWDGYEWNDLDYSEEPGYVAVSAKVRQLIQARPERLRSITVSVEDSEDPDEMALTEGIVAEGEKAGLEIAIVQDRYC